MDEFTRRILTRERCIKLKRAAPLMTRIQKETANRYILLAAKYLFPQADVRPSFNDAMKSFSNYLNYNKFINKYLIKYNGG